MKLNEYLIFGVGLLHVYIMILEMFLWTKPQGLKVFRMTLQKAQDSATLAANQGLYNGFLAAGLIWSVLHPQSDFSNQLGYFFLGCVFVAGLYGARTVSRRIFYVQSLPAATAMIFLFFKI